MTRVASLLFAILMVSATPAETATRVQSGDHIGFARLVVYFDRGQEWSLERTGTGYKLEAPGLGEGYDTSRVFEMIQRDRIATVSSTEDVLIIDLACECEAITSELSSGQLVIDFADAPPTEEPQSDDVANASTNSGPELPASNQPEINAPALPPIELPILTTEPTIEVEASPEPETPVASIEELTEFRRRLLENLGRSASLSLVDLAETPPEQTDNGEGAARHLSIGEEMPDRTRISNAIDNARNPGFQGDPSDERAACPDPALFQIGNWGSEDGFANQISEIRRNLLGEFDEVQPDQVHNLIRAYLHYGLTDEARYVMAQFDVLTEERDILSGLSHLIDGRPHSQGPILTRFDHCDGPIVPWRLLDNPRTATISDAQKQTIAAEFTNWPKSLQQMLGPRLMQILEQRGFETTASFLNAILGDGRPAIDTENTGPSAPLENIKDGVEDGSPEALTDFLRRAIDDQIPIERRYLELASAFERETTGTELSDRLHDLRVEALAFGGNISELTAAMEERLEEGSYTPEVVTATTAHVLNNNSLGDAAIFSAFLLRTGLAELLPDDRVVGLAEQLVEIGLPNFATDFLNARAISDLPVTLDAQLASSDRRTDRLVDLISTLPSPVDRDKRANEILNVAGPEQVPAEVVDALSQETRDRIAWARSDWENVQSEGPEGSISRLIVDLADLELGDEPLTRAMEIQGKAAEARALLDQVLQKSEE